jgi:SOS-response transcriptional repressor LexA
VAKNNSQRVSDLRKKLGLSQDLFAKRLGVSRNYVSMIEGGREPSTALMNLVEAIDSQPYDPPSQGMREEPMPIDDDYDRAPASAITVKQVPVLSWAHAGDATAYEELPKTWQAQTWSTCRDKRAFALIVEGDSMMPHCLPGDLVVLAPGDEPRNGQLVVAKLSNDGILLRRFTKLNTAIRLTAYNPVYPPADYPLDAFHWIYPVHSLNRNNP